MTSDQQGLWTWEKPLILPTVYFPFSTVLIQNLKDPDTTSPHSTYLEQPLEMNELYIFIISERRRGYGNARAHSTVFSEYEEGCGLGHQHQIALVNLILIHFTQASRAFWVGRSDSCHILGISASEVGPLPLAVLCFWYSVVFRTVLWGSGGGGFTCTAANQ